jgi:hypothetical protein
LLSNEITPIFYAKAKRENKKIDQLVNEILKIVLWDEPECLFNGKKYRLEGELFGNGINVKVNETVYMNIGGIPNKKY